MLKLIQPIKADS